MRLACVEWNETEYCLIPQVIHGEGGEEAACGGGLVL